VETTGPSASSDGHTLEEAEEMIREHLWNQSPYFRRDIPIPVRELPVPDIREHLPVQIFRVTDKGCCKTVTGCSETGTNR